MNASQHHNSEPGKISILNRYVLNLSLTLYMIYGSLKHDMGAFDSLTEKGNPSIVRYPLKSLLNQPYISTAILVKPYTVTLNMNNILNNKTLRIYHFYSHSPITILGPFPACCRPNLQLPICTTTLSISGRAACFIAQDTDLYYFTPCSSPSPPAPSSSSFVAALSLPPAVVVLSFFRS